MNNFELRTFSDDTALCNSVAGDWLEMLCESSAQNLAAVSGGRIAQTFFNVVAQLAKSQRVSLNSVQFFWADERCVPPADKDSNYLPAEKLLLQPLGIAPEKIHRLKGELPPSQAVEEANATLQRIAPMNVAGVPVLDVIFLGLGEDGHTASLMPNAPAEINHATTPYVHVANSPKPPPNRISMSYSTIIAAKNVWMLATGAGKEVALRDSLAPNGQTPFAKILQARKHTVIYTDIAT